MRRRLARPFGIAALLTVLVAAQTAALVHSRSHEAHPVNHVCALCVSFATLGSGNVSASQHVDVIVAVHEPVDYLLLHAVVPRLERRFARGPPQAS
jgi:hypothetical protein